MAAGPESRADLEAEPDPNPKSNDKPEISVCESAPGKSVFLESENTEGWIASDTTVEVTR